MACSVCHDSGRIYEHVQDDTGKPCYSCQPPRPPVASFLPGIEPDLIKDAVVECNFFTIDEDHPTEMYTLTARRQNGRYVQFGVTGENIKIFIMEDKIGLKDDSRQS